MIVLILLSNIILLHCEKNEKWHNLVIIIVTIFFGHVYKKIILSVSYVERFPKKKKKIPNLTNLNKDQK